MKMSSDKDESRMPIMSIIGIFFGIFALSLFAAIFFTQSFRGRIVNLSCGVLFIIMAIGSFIISNKSK